MGITGLLPLLKSVQKPITLSELSGKTLAVDAYVWLHRGVCCCATELATGKPTTKYVEYAMQRIRLLQHYNIAPYLVFDGGPLPAKKETEVRRQRKRKESLKTANALAKQGKHTLAREHYLKAVDVTPQMAFQLIKVFFAKHRLALRAHGVPYVVAPYEADAQLFYLESIGVVDGILTEDSDLLIFGAKSLYLKLDTTSSSCILIRSEKLASNSNPDFPLHGWGLKELRECAMLNGCDYLDGIPGVGLKTACKYLRKWGTVEKAVRALRMDGKAVEKDWEMKMKIAEVGFLHQRVWDPLKNQIVYLTEPDMNFWNAQQEHFVGRYIETDLALQISRGDVDPITQKSIIDILPSYQPRPQDPHPRLLASINLNRLQNAMVVETKGSILQYFKKQTDTTKRTANLSQNPSSQEFSTGKGSGKRTLVEEYGREVAVKRRKSMPSQPANYNLRSKFFAGFTPSPEYEVQIYNDDEEKSKIFEVPNDKAVSSRPHEKALNGTQLTLRGRLVDPFLTPTRNTGIKTGIERDCTPDLLSPFHRIAVSPSSTPRSNKDLKEIITDDILDHNERSPNSSEGRITSPPSISATPEECRETLFDTQDSFVTKGVATTDWIKSPVLIPECEYIDDIIEDGFEDRQRLVVEGWERKFSNKAYIKRTPTQTLSSNRTESRNQSFSTVPNPDRKLRVDTFKHKPLIFDDPIQRLQTYRFR
ncbi:hypothetical protein Clacol_007353 [Clathrus columnatus]|uniref:Exonuclease 1 n=1 Tax=Clathrus columnatus TaxID=1419009 RepID=A0AAV5AJ00_9AGAM|nr:hypothetical protein Clacol_007353 [Clathrus columnatus]